MKSKNFDQIFAIEYFLVLSVSLSLFFCLSIYVTLSMSVCLFICVPVFEFICVPVFEFICLSVYISLRVYLCLSACLNVSEDFQIFSIVIVASITDQLKQLQFNCRSKLDVR